MDDDDDIDKSKKDPHFITDCRLPFASRLKTADLTGILGRALEKKRQESSQLSTTHSNFVDIPSTKAHGHKIAFKANSLGENIVNFDSL